jgi:nucleotide-binding universal stress UspA family protein
LLVVDHGAGYIGGQQVGRKLDAAETQAQGARQAFDGQGFGQPGYPFQQDMAIAVQSGKQAVNHALLANDDAVKLMPDIVGDDVELLDLILQPLYIVSCHEFPLWCSVGGRMYNDRAYVGLAVYNVPCGRPASMNDPAGGGSVRPVRSRDDLTLKLIFIMIGNKLPVYFSCMKTILIPTDFSATAKNSAVYAAHLAKAIGVQHILLYNAYSMPLATEMSWAILQTEELKKASEDNLQDFRIMVQSFAGEGIAVETRSDFGFLADRIGEVVKEAGVDLVVMGITGGGKLEEVLIGSNTMHVIHHTDVPVLIVPPDAVWQPIQKLGWACDYKNIIKTTPAETIKKVVSELGAQFVVMHNDVDPKAFDPELFHNNVVVGEVFSHLHPEFVRSTHEDLTEAIDEFVQTHGIQMLLAIPRKHSWIESIFKPSHTKRLAFHSHLPLLCIKAIA